MLQTVNALIIRDMKTKFSDDPLGYGWALLNPLAWIGALVVFFTIVQKQSPIFTDLISFVMSGMLPYMVFRYTITAMMRAKKLNRSLTYIESVTSGKIMISAALVELINGVVVYLVLFSLNYVVYEKAEAHNLLLMMYGYLCAWAIGASVGNFVAELSARYDIFSRIMPVLLRPVFWLSGIFYTANELPLGIAEILTLNPLFQAIEVLRSGAFQGYESRSVVYSQPILFVVIMVLSAELFKRIKKS